VDTHYLLTTSLHTCYCMTSLYTCSFYYLSYSVYFSYNFTYLQLRIDTVRNKEYDDLHVLRYLLKQNRVMQTSRLAGV